MLGKLLKYEFKATARIFLPLYGTVVVLALINKIFMPLDKEAFRIPQMISMSVYCILVAAMFVMTLIVTIQRFYRNLLCDEGYLSFTLPVKTHSHIDAKMITTFVWSVLSVFVMALSILIMAADQNTFVHIGRFFAELSQAYLQYGFPLVMLTLEGIVLLVVSSLSGIVELYAAISIGNLVPKHRLLAGFGSYIGFGIVQQIIISIFMPEVTPWLRSYFGSFHINNQFPIERAATAMILLLAYCLVTGLVFYFLTEWFLNKKLNLE